MQWSLLKDVEQHYPTEKLSTLWSCIAKFHADTFPNLLKLAQLALILPLQTADVERRISAQNLTKTAHRNRMEAETLDNLMTIILVLRDLQLRVMTLTNLSFYGEEKRTGEF